MVDKKFELREPWLTISTIIMILVAVYLYITLYKAWPVKENLKNNYGETLIPNKT